MRRAEDATEERTIVVTGCSSGLGLSMATAAARRGWRTLASVRRPDDAAPLHEVGYDTGILDLADPASIADFAEVARDWCSGRLGALVNNAGASYPGAVGRIRMEDVQAQFQVNVFGQVDLTQRLLDPIREAAGTLVMVSSAGVWLPSPLFGAYFASKRALESFADVLRAEEALSNVRVVTLVPGLFDTSMNKNTAARATPYLDDPEHGDTLRRLLEPPPEGRLHDPADLAAFVLDNLETGAFRAYAVYPRDAALAVSLRRVLPAGVFYRLMTVYRRLAA